MRYSNGGRDFCLRPLCRSGLPPPETATLNWSLQEPDPSIHGLRPELSNVIIRDCSCRGNAGGGLLMNLAALNSSTPPVSISIQNVTVDGQLQHVRHATRHDCWLVYTMNS